MAKVTIQGEKALLRRMDTMSSVAQRRIARPAIRQAAGEIRKLAKRYAPRETGLLKKSIKSKLVTKRGTIIAVVGPARGMKDPDTKRDPANYAHLVEFGTQHSQAQPFLRPAFDGTPSERIISRRMWAEIEKVAKR